jgi:hypothetical protein
MSTHIEATFEIGSWAETPFADGNGDTKLTEALVVKKYDGDIDGSSSTKWLMAYAPDKTATYVGIEHLTGTVGGKRGSLVLMHDGEFRDGVASAVMRVVLGTGHLEGATGGGKFRADPAGSVILDLDGL